jgi:hypothetical protein
MPVVQYYYIIRDALDANHVIAIHKIYDSAIACLNRFIRLENYHRYLDMTRVGVDEFGCVAGEMLMYSYSKQTRRIINHMMIIDTSGADGRPQLMIKLPDE